MACKNNGFFCTCPDGAWFRWCFTCKEENPQPSTSQPVPSPVLSAPSGFKLTSTILKPTASVSPGIVPAPSYTPPSIGAPSTSSSSSVPSSPLPSSSVPSSGPPSVSSAGCQAKPPKKFCVGPDAFGPKCGECDAVYKRKQTAVPVVYKPPRVVPEPNVTAQIKLFRGDERSASEIKFGGFDLWGEARGIVDRLAGASFAAKMAAYICTKCSEKKNGATFADWVRNGKDRSRAVISTAADSGCGGYASGNIFMFTYDGLTKYPFDKAVMPAAFQNIAWDPAGNTGSLEVWMDSAKLETSTIVFIDLKLATQEWGALHKIPPARIVWHRDAKNDGDFETMATVVAEAPKLK